ncbi:hypothetical protein K470DRAFT_274412 [Piedraia hortae CBS 480.64]|uniref:F-box domain-containing protein n=1 Tax=Piedraia hortae CBS 480.64 TaxID=1314780 RepID=A0A6A7C7Z4_9PEZI|nr:hypothetical protein K470DRAFT_274412 [Piedraia hortae CBS 480.64]
MQSPNERLYANGERDTSARQRNMHLPGEILLKVAQCLLGNRASLRSFCLVCHDWVGPGTEILWGDVDSQTLGNVPEEERQDHANFVQILRLAPDAWWVYQMKDRSLPRLKALELAPPKSGTDRRAYNSIPKSLVHLKINAIVNFHGIEISSVQPLYALVPRLPNLEDIELLFDIEGLQIEQFVMPLIRRKKLRSLKVNPYTCQQLLQYIADSNEPLSGVEATKVQSNITTLWIAPRKPSPVFFEALETLQTLEDVHLAISSNPDNKSPVINSHALALIAKLSNLSRLTFDGNLEFAPDEFFVSTEDWLRLFTGLLNLSVFDLDIKGVFDATAFRGLGISCPKLEECVIASSLDLTIFQDETRCLFPNLVFLELGGIALTDWAVEDIPQKAIRIFETIAPKSWDADSLDSDTKILIFNHQRVSYQ